MKYVKNRFTIEEFIKKSRFIGVISPCSDERDVLVELKRCHDEHPSASHIVYAYRVKTSNGLSYRFNDAGEPTGTAGKPIFQQLDGKGLINTSIIVIRYFGGIKLGAGGLTRAYGNTAKLVIDAAEICPYIELSSIALTLDYKRMQALEYSLKKWHGKIIEQDFSEQIRLKIELPTEHVEALLLSFPPTY